MKALIVSIVLLCAFSANASSNLNPHIDKVIDQFHQAAAQANLNAYFELLSDNAVFLGTAPDERWTKKQFKAYVAPFFAKGRGWTYKSIERNISKIGNTGSVFFDEVLVNESYGTCRGSGIMVKTDKGWKIAQYNLSIPVPNDITDDVVKQINHHYQRKQSKNESK